MRLVEVSLRGPVACGLGPVVSMYEGSRKLFREVLWRDHGFWGLYMVPSSNGTTPQRGWGGWNAERICISRVWGLVFPKLWRLVRVAIISVVFEGSTGTSTLVKLPN